MTPNQLQLIKLAASEQARRSQLRKAMPYDHIVDNSIKAQHDFVTDVSRSIAAWTTRRAGKSTGLAHRFIRTMLKHPGCFCPYIALTRDSARNIMWGILKAEARRFNLKAEFTESNLTMTLENGSRLQLFGADMQNFIDRLRGIKTPGAAIDEAQSFRSHIETLIDDVLTPGTMDYTDGWIAVTGTPGPVLRGFFYDITEQKKHGYSIHSWSLFDNPYLPEPKKFVEELRIKKGWSNDNPTLLREYYGRWVTDTDSLVFKYASNHNSYSELPSLTDFVIGLDFGTDDADAIAVIGWHKHRKEAYLVEEFIQNGLSVTEIVAEVDKRIKKYNPLKVVADTGANGKKIALEISKRTGVPVHAAEKQRKIEHITWLNDALRTNLFYARSDSRFADDCSVVEWDYDKSTSDKLVIKDEPHSDICDAVLYAYVECLHWLSEAPPPKVNIKEQWIAHTMKLNEEAMENTIRRQQAEESEGDMMATMSAEDETDILRHYLNKRKI